MNYQDLKEFLNGRSHREMKPHTVAHIQTDNCISIRLYDVDIMKFSPNGKVSLTTNGMYKKTQKERMNEILPNTFHLNQKSGIWYWKNMERFRDGQTITI